MNVKELIEILKQFDEEKEVRVDYEDGQEGGIFAVTELEDKVLMQI